VVRRPPSKRGNVIQQAAINQEYQQALEAELREILSSRQGFLYDLLRYHLGWTDQNGQKIDNPLPLRFQPALALLVCEALGGNFHPALPVAAAVELVYNFTLVHGEVQAGRVDAQERPSIWWVWGPAQAINAGDGLHALGRAAVMRLSQHSVPADRVLKAVETLDRACLTLCEGQFQDLTFRDQLMVTSHDYYDMIQRKSGALAGCSAGLGALASGAEDDVWRQFQEAGAKLGMAWQISQDIADFWGERGDGVTPSNVLNKKKSLPIIYALERASTSAKRELGNIYMKRVLEPDDVGRIIAVLEESEARQHAESEAQRLVEQSTDTLRNLGIGENEAQQLGQWVLKGQA
jgi:geranylgeranyl diphosphate synthase type I